MGRGGTAADAQTMNKLEVQPRQTAAFYFQAAVSFVVSVFAVGLGISYLPVNGWMRSFLALGMLYVVTSSFTLAKCVRDQHEAGRTVQRIDEARLERYLADHDPLRAEL